MRNAILVALLLLYSLSLFSDNRSAKITLHLKNEKVSKAMQTITQQSGMEFAYNPQKISTNHLVTVDVVDRRLDEVLVLIFDKLYTYSLKGRYIIITNEKNNDFYIVVDESAEVIVENVSKVSSGTQEKDCLSIRKWERKPVVEKLEFDNPKLITNNIKNSTMLKKTASLIALSTVTLMPLQAQNKELKVKEEKVKEAKVDMNAHLQKSYAHFSFVYPLTTDGANAKEKEYKFSLNMLGGVTGGINGLEMGGLFNINQHHVKGAQFAGLFNATKGTNNGVQLAGLFNTADQSKGLQMGGLFNLAKESSGVQMAGISNITRGKSIVQMSGVTNVAGTVGTQVSVINIAKQASFQLGIINIAETDDAAMFGLFNYVKKGGLLEVGLSANDYIYASADVVTGTDKLYSILSIGVHPSCVALGFGIGTRFQFGESAKGIQLELKHDMFYNNNFKKMNTNGSLEQLRAFYSYRVNKFNFFGGPTYNVLIRDVDFTAAKKPIYSMWNKRGNNHNIDSWIGAEVGIRFNLK